jgi:hypothetical protein
MKRLFYGSIPLLCILSTLCVAQGGVSNNIEQIVMMRHGEKPVAGLGQLNCQGLNRSLKLPSYLLKAFPNPSYIFAPNPSMRKHDGPHIPHQQRKSYDYIRPLATIEPTAIKEGMPVNVTYGFKQIDKLTTVLLSRPYHSATVYVAWEHKQLTDFAKNLLKLSKRPVWAENNYNKVYVFTINWNKHPRTISFKVTSENINNLSTVCPK